MLFLIAYTTTEGQTQKICRFCADTLTDAGHSVELMHVRGDETLDVARYDGSILAASVHMGRYQKELVQFAEDHGAALAEKPSLFLAVSLAAISDNADELADLDQIAQDFCDRTGYHPDRIEQVAGAFRFTEYDFFRSWAMRYIAMIKKQDVDPHADTEFTDWSRLRAIVEEWAGTLKKAA